MVITHAEAQLAVARLLAWQTQLTDADQRWQMLSAAHIAGQNFLATHWRTHVAMLAFAWQQRDAREMLGQVMRLALVPLGHLTKRLPQGNTGRANVSAFAPMAVPDVLRRHIDAALRHETLRQHS